MCTLQLIRLCQETDTVALYNNDIVGTYLHTYASKYIQNYREFGCLQLDTPFRIVTSDVSSANTNNCLA